MIIDMATRVWHGAAPWPARPDRDAEPSGNASPEAHERAMAAVGVSVLLGFASAHLGAWIPNELIAAHVAGRPDHRLLFAGVDLGAAEGVGQIGRALELGAAGIAISPADQGVRPTDERCWRILEAAAAKRLVVHIANPCLRHPRSIAEFANPLLFDEAARTVSGLRLVLGDLGRVATEEAEVMLGKHPSVWAEVSVLARRPAALHRVLNESFERGISSRLLFGSGFPHLTPEQAIETMYRVQATGRRELLSGLTREVVRGIIERDALAELDLRVSVSDAAGRGRRAGRPVAVLAEDGGAGWRSGPV